MKSEKPAFKVFDVDGDLRGTVSFPEDAAALVASVGKGAYVERVGRKNIQLWLDGSALDGKAADDLDTAALTIATRAGAVDLRFAAIAAQRAEQAAINANFRKKIAELKAVSVASAASLTPALG